MIQKTGRSLLAFVFLFVFAGCDDDNDRNLPGNGEDLPDPGEFHAEISGDMERDLAGTAFFENMIDPETGNDFFFLSLATLETPANNMWFSRGGGRPSSGSYQVLNLDADDLDDSWVYDENRFAFWFVDDPADNMVLFFSDRGSVNIHRSHEDEIAGEFVIHATGFYLADMNTALEVEVRGAFNAIVGDIQPPDF